MEIHGRIARRRKQSYVLRIQGKADILRFRDEIGFAIKQKQEVLESVR